MAELSPLFPLLVLIFSIFIWLKLAKRNNLKLPPSPPKLPIIGNIHQFGKLPHRSLRDLSRNYGPLLLLRLGHNPTLLVSSADMVKEIVKNHDVAFSDRPQTTATDILHYGSKDFGFAPYGEYWKQVRKISVLELFSRRRVQSFQLVRDEEVGVIIDKIRGACRKGEPVNLSDMFLFVSSNIISRCVISRKIEEDDGTCSKMGLLAKRELDAYLDQIIEEHEASKSNNNGQVTKKKDFISSIFQLQQDGMLDMDLTQDNTKANLLDMFLAGIDTTASTEEWLISELLKHPEAMKKLQQEVRGVVGKKSKVEMEDISRMNYLKCVVKETLRLHPVAPLLVPRQTSASVELGGYDIPSNTTVLINAWAIQRDPKWWENPEEFMPERFENSNVDFKGEDFQFIPFGAGRRSCPGLQFGVASIEYLIANLVYWFDWKLADGEIAENLDMSEEYGLAITRKTPLHVLPVLYSHKDCVKNET
ncbi:hypothetical protein V6N11_078408 [Hibiscus sabdariffa]|uniref:Cytochrome P450 n=1 Tax=Hibiscus sabdariffa TaxID=183260 RepID=A0ABR2TFW9_9ROSI